MTFSYTVQAWIKIKKKMRQYTKTQQELVK
jgi:hypothetical protein